MNNKKLIFVKAKESTKKEPIKKKKMFWYDSFYKKMNIIDGDFLIYKYIKEEYVETSDGNIKSLEDIVNETYEYNNERIDKKAIKEYIKSNYDIKNTYRTIAVGSTYLAKKKNGNTVNIDGWFKIFSNYNDAENIDIYLKTEKGTVFSVPSESVEDFCYDLDRNNFDFELVENVKDKA